MLEPKTDQNDQCDKQKKTWVKPEVEIIHKIESGVNNTRHEGSFSVGAKGHQFFIS